MTKKTIIYIPDKKEKAVCIQKSYQIIDVLSKLNTDQKTMVLFTIIRALEEIKGVDFLKVYQVNKKLELVFNKEGGE